MLCFAVPFSVIIRAKINHGLRKEQENTAARLKTVLKNISPGLQNFQEIFVQNFARSQALEWRKLPEK